VLANFFSVAVGLPAASVVLNTGIFCVLYRLFARRKLRFWRTAVLAGIAAFCWQLIGTVGAAFIRLAGHRFLIYGAIAWAVMIMIYVRVLGEIIVFSSMAVSELNPPEQGGLGGTIPP
jgi:uncharacterized BrkB/YihY/UPF0761 family membrane protein